MRQGAFEREIERATRLLTHTVAPAIMTKSQKAVDYLGRAGVNASKDPTRPGTWKDQTGNLRKSISHVVEELPMKTVATVYAGMEYGLYVHLRSGYQVLVLPSEEARQKVRELLKGDGTFVRHGR